MDNARADRLIAVLERIAAALDNTTAAEVKRRIDYDASIRWLHEHDDRTFTPRFVPKAPVEPDRPR